MKITRELAKKMTDEIISALDPKECADLVATEIIQYYVARKHPEVMGWYYDEKTFCSDKISTAIVTKGIEYYSPKQDINL